MNPTQNVITNSNTSVGLLSFLKPLGFHENDTCAYGCCTGWLGYFKSSEGLYFNRCAVYITDNKIVAKNHKEYNCGGFINSQSACVSLSKLKNKNAMQDAVKQLIKHVLPTDLD